MEDIPLPLQYQERDNADFISLAFMFLSPDLNMEEKNILKYIAKRVESRVCDQCEIILTGHLQGTDDEIFMRHKQFNLAD